jgi:hypothetical protein
MLGNAMMSPEQWTERVAGALNDLQDRDYQERVWLRGLGPEVSSFDEVVNRLFDDYDLAGFLKQPHVRVRTSLVDSLRAVQDSLKGVDEVPMTLATLRSPAWECVRRDARAALELLQGVP